ncbi:metal-dependent transcriptional regulator [Candidatus Woesearchaeota archaeon]|nr:metal-dependent transcriptional regulator [Candidatus Woesearchaeota archaeon]MBI2654899.1 metal-dependent transcriptional regulator [Candidatus Woesearchaeota archaeon]
MFTANREDYLRGLYILEEEKGEIKSIDLAHYLDVSKPSVSEMAKELNKEGLISYKKYSKLRFTSKGRRIAQKLTSKHRLIELFLKKILKINSKNIHHEAHRLEHAFSDESITKLRRLLGNPKKDPHGKPISQ